MCETIIKETNEAGAGSDTAKGTYTVAEIVPFCPLEAMSYSSSSWTGATKGQQKVN